MHGAPFTFSKYFIKLFQNYLQLKRVNRNKTKTNLLDGVLIY